MKHALLMLVISIQYSVFSWAQAVSVRGEIINGIDCNGLPLCVVQLYANGVSKAKTFSDYAGRYDLPQVEPGCYNIVIVQFGDTLCNYHGLTVMRDTWVRHIVWPTTGDTHPPTIDDALGITMLRQVKIQVRVINMLEPMGLLIKSPDDPRLWNFSGHMDEFEDTDISFWYKKYKLFYKLRAMGHDITSPFEQMYPENHYTTTETKEDNTEENP